MHPKKRIKKIVKEIINLPKQDKNFILELLDHDEWGVALEHLSSALYEENISISKELYLEIKDMAKQMEMKSSDFDFLKSLITEQ